MPSFPTLKTSAVAQYPATKTIQFQNQVLRFVDGTEQKYRDNGGPLRQWVIRLDALDETELASLEQFFAANQGRLGSFAFTDPWDASQYANCSLAADGIELMASGELRCQTSLTVIENRG
jgi:Conserved hypothetical protein 2217 (DUF2460)